MERKRGEREAQPKSNGEGGQMKSEKSVRNIKIKKMNKRG